MDSDNWRESDGNRGDGGSRGNRKSSRNGGRNFSRSFSRSGGDIDNIEDSNTTGNGRNTKSRNSRNSSTNFVKNRENTSNKNKSRSAQYSIEPTVVDVDEQEKRKQRALRFEQQKHQHQQHHQEYGLLSRGTDTRLQANQHGEREAFFAQIQQNFLESCAKCSTSKALKQEIMKIQGGKVLGDLRKLREALLSQSPTEFSTKVMVFSLQIGSRMGHYQTYIPCSLYLLEKVIGTKYGIFLEEEMLDECVGVYILHMCHNKGSLESCFELWSRLIPHNLAVRNMVKAVAENNYVLWFDTYRNQLSRNLSYRAILEKYGAKMMGERAIEAMNGSYYKMERRQLEDIFGLIDWREMKGAEEWQEEGGVVVLRKRR